MSVITHRDSVGPRDTDAPSATASDLAFARPSTNRHFWRRTKALVRRAYGPLIVYASIFIALVATVALKIAIWVPMYWR